MGPPDRKDHRDTISIAPAGDGSRARIVAVWIANTQTWSRIATMTYGTLTGGYPATSKWLHWLVALCVLITIPVAIVMGDLPEGPLQDRLFHFHKSLGVLILILVVLRLINRLVVGAPAPDPAIAPWQRKASSAVHGLIYVLLFAMPLSGMIAHSIYGEPIPFFVFEIPTFTPKNEPLSDQIFEVHHWMGFVFAALVLIHIGAALFHHFIHRDNVLRRMLPRALGGL
jgi:cytochrome b561